MCNGKFDGSYFDGSVVDWIYTSLEYRSVLRRPLAVAATIGACTRVPGSQ